jgi:Fe-S cluster assembly protein SufD
MPSKILPPELLPGLVVAAGETVVCFLSPKETSLSFSANVRVEAGGSFFFRSLSLGASKVELSVELSGESARCDVRSAAIAENSKAAVMVRTLCAADNTSAVTRIAAFALPGGEIESRAVAEVAKGIRQVESVALQSNVFLGNSGKIRGIPELRVASNDVKARHACSVERVSAEALFYLRSRGLSAEAATASLLSARISEIFSHLPQDCGKSAESFCFLAISTIVSGE